MAKIIIRIEKDDIKTNKLGENIIINCENVDIIFTIEAIEELIKDYGTIKLYNQK